MGSGADGRSEAKVAEFVIEAMGKWNGTAIAAIGICILFINMKFLPLLISLIYIPVRHLKQYS